MLNDINYINETMIMHKTDFTFCWEIGESLRGRRNKNSGRNKMESLVFKIQKLMFTFFNFIPM